MDATPDPPVFACANKTFSLVEVLHWAASAGYLSAVEDLARAGESSRRYAEKRGHEISDDDMQRASESFRAELGLNSADATHRWLRARGVGLDDFANYLERALWRNRYEKHLEKLRSRYPIDDSALRELVRIEAVFSGAFDQFVHAAAQRVSVVAEMNESSSSTPAPEADAADWAALERLFSDTIGTLMSPERIARELQHRRLEFMRVRVEVLAFPDENVATEAYWCIAEEGAPLADFSKAANAPPRTFTAFLRDLPKELELRFLSGEAGEVFPPTPANGKFEIYRLHEKLEPDADDPDTRARLERDLTGKYVESLVQKHIHWLIP